MDLRNMLRKSFISVLLVLVAACGGSEEVYTGPSADGLSGVVSQGQSNGRVRMTTSPCGTAPTTNVAQSNDIDAPTIMTTGQIVSGNIYAGSSFKHVNYWDIALEAGYYHVVLESERMNRKHAQLGLNLSNLNINGTADGTQIISGSAKDGFLDFRARFYGFIELQEARNVVLRVTHEYLSEDYRLAVFKSASAVWEK